MGESYSVYVHTVPDGRRYVGVTAGDPKKRWNYGSGYNGNQEFYKVIREVGWGSIRHEVVATGLSQKEALDLERDLVCKYNTVWPNGFNHTMGGEYPGRMLDSTRAKLRARAEMRAPDMRKRCRCVETGVVYQSITDAAKKMGTHRSAIARACAKGSSCGYLHFEYVDDSVQEDPDWYRDWVEWNSLW